MSVAALSLRARLLLVATCVLLVFLGLTGFVLDQAFRRSAEQGVSERLQLQIYGLLGASERPEGELFLPEVLQEPDFNRLGTGLYALVFDDTGREIWRSPSALDLTLPPAARGELHRAREPGRPAFGRIETTDGRPLFYVSYRVLWQGAGQTATPYTYVTAQTLDTYRGEVGSFRNNLWGWLALVVVVLIAVQALVMRWGLEPLRRLAADLKQIEDGRQDYLEGQYPAEIQGVTRNLNLLLAAERQQREKYRTTLADLAHSLKTPLAILRGSVASAPDDSIKVTVDEQVARMDEIVGYQLGRALTTTPAIIRKAIDVPPVLERLVDAMRKVYARKSVDIELSVGPCTFFGDERDLMELTGNLVDNACKYSASRIRLEAGAATDGGALRIVVEDDGPGIPEDQREAVLHRGMRLDSGEPGQGIGLAIVADLVDRYRGTIAIDDSVLGGARVTVSLP